MDPGQQRPRGTRAILIFCSAVAAFLLAQDADARTGTLPPSKRLPVQPLGAVRQFVAQPVNRAAELEKDRKATGGPLRFAVPHRVKLTPETHGQWEDVDGGRLWRLRVLSAGSTDLNFGFSSVSLPEGVTLHIASETEDYFQGPFESRDNRAHGQLWTPVIPGDRAVIELFVPHGIKEPVRLALTQISGGYRDLFNRAKDLSLPKAGTCNIDVACAQAMPWDKEIRSVARYSVDGTGLCTGTLVNNGRADGKPYFLTAYHCEVTPGSAASVVVYWNFQSPVCGQHGGGSLGQNQSGAIFRAGREDVDMTLIELEELPNPSFNAIYSGWDRKTNSSLPGVTGIHHPNGDEKSISFSSNQVTVVNNCIGTGGTSANTHYSVTWTSGVTEPGSSGSGIWTHDTHRLVGFLSGGESSCSKPFDSDCYGRFSVAWEGPTASQRLRDWLDPVSSAPLAMPLLDPSTIPLLGAGAGLLVSEQCSPTNGAIDPGEMVSVRLTVMNAGGVAASNVVGTLLAQGGVTFPSQPQNYSAISPGAAVERTFSFIATGFCGGTLQASLQLQSGATNLGTFVFAFPLGAPFRVWTQNFDSVTAPAFPAGWAKSSSGVTTGWQTTTSVPLSPPNAAYAPNTDEVSDDMLTSPSFSISSTNARIAFWHSYDVEMDFDGGVLEISISNGAFADLLAAGGSFISHGYDWFLSEEYENPLAGRQAWTGWSDGYVKTEALLPASAAGQSVRLRWRLGSDSSYSEDGWRVENVEFFDGSVCCTPGPSLAELRRAGGSLAFSFNTLPGKTYISEVKTNLHTNSLWVPFATNAGDGSRKSVTNSTTSSNRFIRVRMP